jgi:dihydrofolate reductase
MPKPFIAIAAMSLNRVIGRDNKLPWHLPEELKWFKQKTTGHVLVMGRKTFQSIGKPLPNRETIVLSRGGFHHPAVKVAPNLQSIESDHDPRNYFLVGGEEIFRIGLPFCSDLFLTRVKMEVEGDAFFPPFEHLFGDPQPIMTSPNFDILHYQRPVDQLH